MALISLTVLAELLLQVPSVNRVHAQAQPSAAITPLSADPPERVAARKRTSVEQSSAPQHQVEETRRHSALLISGVSTFISSYLMSAFFGVLIHVMFGYDCAHESDRACNRANALFIPLIGALFPTDSLDTGMRTFVVGSQAFGLVLTVVGALVNTRSSTRSRLAASTQASRASLHVSVAAGASGTQLTASVTF
jgi:hypothetical protein